MVEEINAEHSELMLDIDGVINSSRSVHVKYGNPLADPQDLMALAKLKPEFGVTYSLQCVDPICVGLVNKLLTQKRGIGLVLSSSHRGYLIAHDAPFGSQAHLGRLRLYLRVLGIRVPSRFSVLPNRHAPRGYAVDAWIDEHGEPDRYAILDDSPDFSSHHPLVLTNAEVGMDFDNFNEASKLLGLETSVILI